MNYAIIWCFIWTMVLSGVAYADEPGNWLLNLKESKEAFLKAGDKEMKNRVNNARQALERGGCVNNRSAECERKRADYLSAAKDYLVNAEKYIDLALRCGDSALAGYRKDGKTARTMEAIKTEARQAHNNISKIVVLQDLAVYYDPERPKIITREALRGLASLELGLEKDVKNFSDKEVDIDSYTLVLRALRTGVHMRLELVKQAAKINFYETTMQMLCMESKNADECHFVEVGTMVTAIMGPLEDMGSLTTRSKISQSGSTEAADESVKRHFSTFQR